MSDIIDSGYNAEKDAKENKAMAVLAYLGILVLIPILAAPKSKFARFHANQGLVLLIACIAYSIVMLVAAVILAVISSAIAAVFSILQVIGNIVIFVFLIMGIINACTGKMKELPLIGKIHILK